MNTTFTLQGGKQLEARLRALGKAPREILRETGIRGVAEAKHLVPRKTGNLGRTIRMGSLTDTYVEIKAGGQNNVGYAAFVEKGTRGGKVIVPRKAKVLAWGGPRTLAGGLRKGGRATNFAMRVTRGATRAYPYLVPGLESAIRMVGLGSLVDAWNRSA